MTKVVIIGASVAGHTTAVALREKNKNCEITLITQESHPFYEKRRLVDFLAGRIKESQLLGTSEEFYSQQGIVFLKEKEVTAVNPGKKRIFIEEDASFDYDLLAVCSGRSFVLADIPGVKKRGVFRLHSLNDAKEFLNYLINAPICIVGSNPLAIAFADSIASKQKEVKLIAPLGIDPALKSAYFTEAFSEQPAGTIEVVDSQITEIIGDGEVQAIRIKTGKIIGACVVIFADRTQGNISFLKNSNIEMYEGLLCVDEALRTNLDSVYASGSVCTGQQAQVRMKIWDEVVREGYALADSIHLAISS
ncbi:MAG: FAD-dependent oxidoreductase [Candidatus Omnitrophota bacterium]|jgi:NAD(P)H-nitrite reductase large subunit|nr:MAG: FAD-dependent oxidoreductase [Candidatus Omnitrophota bacterium]